MSNLFYANALFLRGSYKEAFDEYMEIVKDIPDPIAAANIGYMYYRGIGVERNYESALAFFNAAAPLDEGASYFNLSLMYMRGQGVSVDLEKSAELMKKSADHGCPNAMLYLGLAYILGYFYDPVEIECITLIPFYQVIYRDATVAELNGVDGDESIEDKRYEVLCADETDAIDMYENLYKSYKDTYGFENEAAMAQFMIGKAFIDGIGKSYNPQIGYSYIYQAAINYGCAEAASFLLANADTARAYNVNVDKIDFLFKAQYFRGRFDNKNTSDAHKAAALLEEKRDNIKSTDQN